MEKRIGIIMKYVGYTGIGLMFIGLLESAMGFGAEHTAQGFSDYLKAVVTFKGADTIMTGIWLVLAAPIAGLFYVLFYGLKARNYRLAAACAVIVVILAFAMIIGE